MDRAGIGHEITRAVVLNRPDRKPVPGGVQRNGNAKEVARLQARYI